MFYKDLVVISTQIHKANSNFNKSATINTVLKKDENNHMSKSDFTNRIRNLVTDLIKVKDKEGGVNCNEFYNRDKDYAKIEVQVNDNYGFKYIELSKETNDFENLFSILEQKVIDHLTRENLLSKWFNR